MNLTTHPLFVGLTRPPMFMGVTLTFLGLNGVIGLIAFIMTSSFLWFFMLAGVGHIIGYFCCLYDPRIFELLLGWLKSKGSNRNVSYWRCSSYDPS